MNTAAALEINLHRCNSLQQSSLAVAITVQIKISQGWSIVFALLDLSAEANFVNQQWAKENNLSEIKYLSQEVSAIDGHYVKIYGHHILEAQLINSHAVTQSCTHAFEAVDLSDYDLILNYSWLQVVNLNVN